MVARLSREMAELLDRMAAEDGDLPDATTLPPAEGRAQTARVQARWRRDLPPVGNASDFTLKDADGSPMRCRRIDPLVVSGPGAILFFHGGGWAFCDIDTHEDPMRRLSNAAGMPLFACDYRLAPENRFPAGLNDCISFWRRLRDGTLPGRPPPGPLFVAGDSAGANLALALTLSEIAAGGAAPSGALLIYGAYGLDFDTGSYQDHAEGPGLTRDKMRRFWDWYGPADRGGEWRVAPLAATDDMLRALPPLIIVAAEIDPLLSDSELLLERLAQKGRNDRFLLLPGMTHGSIQMGSWLSAAVTALEVLGQSLRDLRDRTEISASRRRSG